jgi:hypothetical protein
MERKRNVYGMSEYLMIMHELERARLADRARKESLRPEAATRNGRRICQTNPKEVTTCPQRRARSL